jgi:hypothetical protein
LRIEAFLTLAAWNNGHLTLLSTSEKNDQAMMYRGSCKKTTKRQENETRQAGQSKQPRPVQILDKGVSNVSRFNVWDSLIVFSAVDFPLLWLSSGVEG